MIVRRIGLTYSTEETEALSGFGRRGTGS
jgi:hypothetical protein